MKHSILIRNKGIKQDCFSNKNLMDSLYVHECLVPNGCHNGGCGVCKIKVHSGKYTTLKMSRSHISEEEERNGVVLACRVLPQSEMEIELIAEIKPMYKFGS